MTPEERYILGRVLGAGGVGEVVEANDRKLARSVALKFLDPKASAAEKARFDLEGRLTAQLTHPNIVPVYDVGELGGRAFICMKRVRGRSLQEVIEAREFKPRERLLIFLKVCDAIAFAHEREVVHRDLKPDNVMVGAFGEVLVMDWGLARTPDFVDNGDRLTRVGQIMGTPYYMSPEQAQGHGRDATPAMDIYALGAMLFALCAGRPPLDADDLLTIVKKAAVGDILKLRDVAPGTAPAMIALVDQCMALDPQSRPQNAMEVADRVRAHLMAPGPGEGNWWWMAAFLAGTTLLAVVVGGCVVLVLVLLR